MGQLGNHQRKWEEEDISQKFKNSLSKLDQYNQKHTKSKKNLSKSSFQKAQAMRLCEESMQKLSYQYINHVEAFKRAKKPQEALFQLDKAETIWKKESSIIKQFDKEGKEVAFLKSMRELYLVTIMKKLESVSQSCYLNPSSENIALSLGIICLVDVILEEFGHPPNSPQRERFRNIAKSFT